MNPVFCRNSCFLIMYLFFNSGLLAQDSKIVSDKIISFSDPRLPNKLVRSIKTFNSSSLNENISFLKGSTSETDTIFYNLGTIKYKWNIKFDTILGVFTGHVNQIAYIRENNSKKSIKTIENNYIVLIQEEVYCCMEKPEICCLWVDRKKYSGCTWVLKVSK